MQEARIAKTGGIMTDSDKIVFQGVEIPMFFRKPQAAFYTLDLQTNEHLLVTKSDHIIARFPSLSDLNSWFANWQREMGIASPRRATMIYDSQLALQRLRGEAQARFRSENSLGPKKNSPRPVRTSLSYDTSQATRHIVKCACGSPAMPNESTCYNCKSE